MTILFLIGCPGPEPLTPTPTIPLVVDVSVTLPNPNAPLVRQLVVDADRAVTVVATWTDGDHLVESVFDRGGTHHEHLLLGWRPDRTYDLTITATDAEGIIHSESIAVDTEPLPERFPQAELTVLDPDRVAPGNTLISLRSNARGTGLPDNELIVVFDEEGEVVWYLSADFYVQDVREFDGGLLSLAGKDDPSYRTLSWDGLQRNRWAIAESTEGTPLVTSRGGNLHHEVIPVPDDPGRMFALARHGLPVAEYPTSYVDLSARAPGVVANDYILEFLDDGTILDETPISDLIPFDRIGYESLNSTTEGWLDWSHANALVPDGDQVVVSLRNQDAIVKIDTDADEIQWILGHHDNWPPELQDALLEPIGEVRWPWHAHAPMFGDDLPDGRRQLLLFDNGNYQAAPFTGIPPIEDPTELHSRVAAFWIDETAKTVEQAWSYDQSTVAGGDLFCFALGDADWLEGGTVLATFGFVGALPDQTPNEVAGLGNIAVRVVEFDPMSLSDVWHLYLSVDRTVDPNGWTTYRSDRIPSIVGRVIDADAVSTP